MVWLGNEQYRLAPSLRTLWNQLVAANPGQQWQTSPQTGTIGDAKHQAKNRASDHNPWLDNTVRALDIAANVTGVPGIRDVADGPSCEALFAMVNQMYAARDPRIWPDGYGIYLHRITDPARPGRSKPTTPQQDPHLYHLHISVSTNPAGFNSTAPWPIPQPARPPAPAPTPTQPDHQPAEDGMYEVLRNEVTGAVRAGSPGGWVALDTPDDIANALTGPLLTDRQPVDKATGRPKPRDVSDPGMTWWKNFYLSFRQQ